MSTDYVPVKDADFDGWFNNLIDYVDTKTSGTPPAWPNIPGEAAGKLIDAYQPWHTAFVKMQGAHTKVDTEVKNEKRKSAESIIRPFVKQYLHFPPVTDADRTAMGIPNWDTTSTNHPVPAVKPDIDAEPSGKGKHTVTAINPQTQNKKKPALVKGVAFAHKVRLSAEPKADPKDMASDFQAAAVKNFQWGEENYGKVADYAAAYENAGGKRGPWSDVASVIIA
jgi:hypothetical protein